MKKNLIISFVLLFSCSVFADTLLPIRNSKDKLISDLIKTSAEVAYVISRGYDGSGGGTVSAAYKVNKMVLKDGESMLAGLTRNLKRALHRDYPITGDDGGYAFSILRKKSQEQILQAIDSNFTQNEDAGEVVSNLVELLEKASASADYAVLVGTGSGNNTFAAIIAVINIKTSEVIYLMDSNFGSDS